MSQLLRRALLLALGLYLFLPILASLAYSVATSWTALLPEGYTLKHWANLLENQRFWLALGRTALLSFSVVALSIFFLVPTLFVVRMYYPRVAGVLEFLTLWPFVFPGVILAVGLISLYSSPPLQLAQTPFLLIAAVTVISLPYAYRAVDNAFAAADIKTLAEAPAAWGPTMPRPWPGSFCPRCCRGCCRAGCWLLVRPLASLPSPSFSSARSGRPCRCTRCS